MRRVNHDRSVSSVSSVVASLAVVVVLLTIAPACHRSPTVAFARLLDQAASWAAAVEFAGEMRSAGAVPEAYVRDFLKHAAEELTRLQQTVAHFEEAAPSARAEASALCARLASILEAATRDGSAPAAGELHAAEMRLRDLARDARGDSEPRTGRVAR